MKIKQRLKQILISIMVGTLICTPISASLIPTATTFAAGITGLKSAKAGSTYYKNGKADTSYTGLANLVDTSIPIYDYYYVKKGKVDRTFTGIVKFGKDYWYVHKGHASTAVFRLVKATYNGTTAYWWISGGRVALNKNGVVYDCYNDSSTWNYYVIKDGKLNVNYDGFAKVTNEGLLYFNNGISIKQYVYRGNNEEEIVTVGNTYDTVKVNGVRYALYRGAFYNMNGASKFGSGMYYFKNGVQYPYTGLARVTDAYNNHKELGIMYFNNGVPMVNFTGIVYGTDPELGGGPAWWLVKNGWRYRYSGIYPTDTGWYYCDEGKVDWSRTGITSVSTKLGTYNPTKYWVENGMVNFNKNGRVYTNYIDGIYFPTSKIWYTIVNGLVIS